MTSKKQIEANRKNAKKGGVKTEAGKEVSKMNALTHGILSHHLYIPNNSYMTKEELVEFQSAFVESMQPEGMMETLLVDRLIATFLRLQRLYIAEAGSVMKQIEGHTIQLVMDQIEANALARNEGELGFLKRMRTNHGCSQLADAWQAIAETIEEKGLPLGKGMSRALDEELGGRSGFYKAECVSICNYAVQNKKIADPPMDEEEEARVTQWALQYARDLESFFRSSSEMHEWNEEDLRKADKKSKMLPPLADLEKMQRYDAHLQRVMIQTLHELQRLQSLRLGYPVSAPAALDIN